MAAVPAQELQRISEYHTRDVPAIRREIIAAGQPAVLRGLVSEWPAVQAGRRSTSALLSYLRRLDSGAPVDAIMTPPEVRGRIFYQEGMNGFNFVRNRLPLSQIAEQTVRYAAFPQPPAVAVQSAPLRECLPGFASENPLPLADASALPRIWLGNAITTPTHLDEWFNLGCVVCGRRRFTLFPPEQISNLYIGPLDYAPTGAPMSLVHLHAPDLERFPRFATALAAARTAELLPGDVLYIPPLWWHHVESLEPLNVLINYWWHASGAELGSGSGYDALLHAILNIRPLPAHARAAWSALFQHYVFGSAAGVTEHIVPERRGILGQLSPAEEQKWRTLLAKRLLPPS
jgi:hypothetical protein